MRRRRSLSWLVSAGRGAAAVSVVAALLAARPGPATAHDMTADAASPPPAARYNVAATHSPRLRQMLSGAGPATGEQSAAPSASQTAGLAQGVDVASFQHNGGATIDWSQVAAAGYTFAFVKSSEGSYYVNPYYVSDTAAARKAGLLVAAYHFAIPNDSSAILQADLAANAAGDPRAGGATLPLILDIEYDPYVAFDHTNSCYGLTPAAMTAWLAAFIAEAQRRDGTLPVIYTTAGWWNTCTGSSAAFSADPLWIASSGTSPALPADWTNWSYWQYTSAATVPGIPGKVDVSYLNSGVVAAAQPQAHSGAAGGTIQLGVRSLAAAAGETMTYSAGGLPPGLSIDPASGVITGSLPSAPASYPVTVTLSAGGEAQAVRFTWYVHGPVSLTHPGTQNSMAGSAVDLQLSATDGLSGCSLSFRASGLPPGLAISSCGRIAGFASKPGSYRVTVRAADSASVVASASFTWTVSSPLADGMGRLRLALDDKCLAGLAGTSGTLTPRIWTCQKSTGQQWLLSQDGTVRLGTKCLAALFGSAGSVTPALRTCTGSLAQQWRHSGSGGLASAQAGLCLTDPNGSHVNGTAVTLAYCDDRPRQAWTLPAGHIAPDLHGWCLTRGGGTAASPTLARCATAASQVWAITPGGAISVAGSCLTAQQPGTPGARVGLAACAAKPGQGWQPMPGQAGTLLVNNVSGLCLAAPSQLATGAPLTLASCVAGYPRLSWREN